jgi:hypothetical protein
MEIIGFLAGAAFGIGQYALARKMILGRIKSNLGALYILQLLILSLGLLVLVFFVWREALLAVAIGIVAASMSTAVIFALKW